MICVLKTKSALIEPNRTVDGIQIHGNRLEGLVVVHHLDCILMLCPRTALYLIYLTVSDTLSQSLELAQRKLHPAARSRSYAAITNTSS